MEVQISLAVEKPAAPVRTLDEIPVYPMGHDLSMVTTFVNKGARAESIDDPQVSQDLLLRMKQEGPEDPYFMLHPSEMDATGEVTGPEPAAFDLKPDQEIAIPFDLHKMIVDQCFLPGFYELYIEFHELKSPPFKFGVEYRAESVPRLVEIAIDESANSWLRDEAMAWLKKLPKAPQVAFADEDEDEETTQKRVEKNKEHARQYLDDWEYGRNNDEITKFFEEHKLQAIEL